MGIPEIHGLKSRISDMRPVAPVGTRRTITAGYIRGMHSDASSQATSVTGSSKSQFDRP